MTPAAFQNALLDLGWTTLAERALRLGRREAIILRTLVSGAGAVVPTAALAMEVFRHGEVAATNRLIIEAVETIIVALSERGCSGVVQREAWGFRVWESDVPVIETAMLRACGVRLLAPANQSTGG